MNKIKFRAWDNHKKQMCYHVDVYHDNWWAGQWFYDDGNKAESFTNTKGNSLMQWTGLKDCKGVNVFEGDIVKYDGIVSAPNDRFGQKYTEIVQVEFVDGCFLPFNRPWTDTIEVIGNIKDLLFQGPEGILRKRTGGLDE